MVAKIYLIIVALLYISLAIWCTVAPRMTSEKVGFQLIGGSGQSEFLTVYGGLEIGVALVLLYFALFRPDTIRDGVLVCVLIHGSLVVFRSVSLFAFEGIGSFTYRLAIGEWAIFLLGLAIWIFTKKS